MKNPTPSPVVVTTICSLCDLPWEAHGDKPTTEDCIRLLKAELASRPSRPIIIRDPYLVPYVQPRPYVPAIPWWAGDRIVYGTSTTTAKVEFRTPSSAAITCSSVET